jgi:branched-chain amino acid transport system substrate-binding protein
VLVRFSVAVLALCFSIVAAAQVRIGLMVSATGPTTAIGIPQKNTGDLLPRKIGDVTIEYFQYDDGGDTTRAVQNVKKLIQEHNVDALIGPSTTPNALAILDVIAENKVPLMATVGTSSVVEPLDAKKRWVFKTTQNDDLIAAALVRHMVKNGVKTVGFIGFKDPYGENWHKVFSSIAEPAGIKLIATEYYLRTDSSVTGQALKLIAAKPDAVLVAGVGGPGVLPQTTLRDQGYKSAIYQTHGVATDDFIRLGKDKVEGTVLAAGPMLVIDEIADSNPIKKVAQAYIRRVRKAVRAETGDLRRQHLGFRAHFAARDSGCDQSRKTRNEGFRSALRDAIEREREVVGCQGVFNMSPTNHNGMDERARVLVTVKDGKFRLLPE